MSGINADEVNPDVNVVASVLPTGASTSALQTSGNSLLTSIDSKTPALVSGRQPVDGSGVTQPVSGTVTANAGTNLNTSALALEASQVIQNNRIGDLTETAPASDTASSGLNGRLQRIAQRITTAITTLTDGTQRTKITNGTNDSAVKNVQPLRDDYGLVTRVLPYYPPTFVVTANAIDLGNNKSMIAIQNTSTSVVRIRRIYLVNTRTAATTGVVADFRLLRIQSFSGGTSLIIYKMDTQDTLPAGITAATNSTVVSEADLYRQAFWSSDEWGGGTVDVEAQDHTIQELIPWYETKESEKPITLIQNQGVHIRCATNTTNGTFHFNVVFTVED